VGAAALFAGIPAAWRIPALRDGIIAWSIAGLLAIACAMLVANMQWTRLALWLAPLWVLATCGIFSLLLNIRSKSLRRAAAALAAIACLSGLTYADWGLSQIPPQPIYGGLMYAQEALGSDSGQIVGVYMAAQESQLYIQSLHSDLSIAYTLPQLQQLEQKPGPIALVVFYEKPLEASEPALAAYIQSHYVLKKRLPGRISSVAVYTPH
jgi:hypothetical protein